MSNSSHGFTQAATPEQNKLSAQISAINTAPIPIGERYELLGALAKGGMGAIHEAWDIVLERHVAVKFIHEQYADSVNIQRFHDEAMIAGQLQHPNIPPIYDLGRLPDGKPFLAMKLIQGHTLDSLIKRDRSTLHVLSVFEGIAQAVGYAHSRNVIHRDLKPANVMVGAFGEVQVMDWGLAKVLRSPEGVEASHETSSSVVVAKSSSSVAVRTHAQRSRGTGESHTSVGDIMGTPAYMPPEQALGDIANVNKRSDVFGLGGILCAMLTGQPPFVGSDPETTRQIAAEGRMSDAFARLDSCGAESEVIALAKRCLAVAPNDRPADGNEVAMMVGNLREQAAQRARNAEIGIAQAATRRRVLLWSAGAVVAVLVAGMATSISQANRAILAEADTQRQLQRTIAAERETHEQLVKTQAAEAAEHAKTVELEATLKLVDERTQLAHNAYGQMVVDMQNLLSARPGTTELRKALLEKARLGLSTILDAARKQAKPDRLLVWSHYRMAEVEQNLGNIQAALREYRSGVALAERLLDADGEQSSPTAQQLRDVDYGYQKLGDFALLLGQPNEARTYYETMHRFEQRLVQAEPKNLGFQRNLGVCYIKLGDVTRQLGDARKAVEYYQKQLQNVQQLLALEPTNSQFQRDRAAVELKLGDAQFELKNPQQALTHFTNASERFAQLVATDRENPEVHYDLSVCYERLNDATRALGQHPEALDYQRRAVTIRQQLVDADPKNAQLQRGLALGLGKLGSAQLVVKQHAAARVSFEQARAIQVAQLQIDPQNVAAHRSVFVSYYKLGTVAESEGDYATAIGYYEQALAVIAKSPRPALFAAEAETIRAQIGDCRGLLPKPERAPNPRASVP